MSEMASLYSLIVAGLALLLPPLVAFCIWRVVVSARTPQGASAWVVFLLAAPWFALPGYAFFGPHKFRGYQAERRNSRRVMKRLDAFCHEHPPEPDGVVPYRAFERIARMPVVGGNAAELLIDGEATYAAILDAIDRAERYVCLQVYTLADDGLGRRVAKHLGAAVARGVAVRVLYDGVGSYGLPARFRLDLEAAGVQVVDPRRARGPTSRLQVNFRNHRKTVIVDGREGFVGGHNISDTYIGLDPRFGHWRDTHVALRGPVVTQLQLVFAEDWHWATGESLGEALEWHPHEASENLPALIVASGPVDDMDTGGLFFFSAIAEARSRVWIASPYFVPDTDILTALKAAALRGVDVRVLVPDQPDHYLTWIAAFAFYDEVREAGVEVLRYREGFMHQKVVLVDDRVAAVGSANLDNRSFRLNFETMAMVFDDGFASRVAEMLEADFAHASAMTQGIGQEPLWLRLLAPVARLLAPVL